MMAVQLPTAASGFIAEDRGGNFLRNAGDHTQHYMVSQSKRLECRHLLMQN